MSVPTDVRPEPTSPDHPATGEGFSGQVFTLQSDAEVAWFQRALDGYQAYEWTDHSDLATLDQMLGLQLMTFRYTAWLSSGTRYDGEEIDLKEVQVLINQNAKTVKDLSESLGLNRKSRQADGASSFAEWHAQALQKARLFSIKRYKEYDVAFARMHQLASIIDTYERSDDEERVKIGFRSYEDICRWFMENAYPDLLKIDEEFIAKHQIHWKDGDL